MKHVKQAKMAYIIFSVLFVLIGLFVVIWPGTSAKVLCMIIGTAILLFGVLKLIGYFINDTYGLAFQFDLALGIFSAVVGVVLLLHPNEIIRLLPEILGIFILIDGVFKFQTAIDAKKFGLTKWPVIMILGIATGIMGIFLIFRPFNGAELLMIMLGASLMLDGIQNLYIALYAVKSVKYASQKENRV